MDEANQYREAGIQPFAVKLWLALAFIEGVAAFCLLFAVPSEPGRSLLLGFSLSRLLLGLAVLAVTGLLAWRAWRAWRDGGWLQQACTRLDGILLGRDWLVPTIFAAGLSFLFLTGFLSTFGTRISYQAQDFLLHYPAWMTHAVDLLRAGVGRAYPVIAWAAALSLQTLALVLAGYPAVLRRKWQEGSFFKAALVLLMAALSIFHWTVLVFQLKTFMVIPGWKWYITPKELLPHQYALFVVLFFLALLLIRFILTRPPNPRRSIAILIALGYALQVGFGFIAGGGFEAIRLKYADSIFNGYAWAAAEQPPLYPALYNFETLYGSDRYLGTKPPGILVPYVLTEKAASLLSPSMTVEERFYKLTRLAAYTYPLIAFSVLIVLAFFSRRLLKNPEDAVLPAIIYILCPNVILIPLFLDQVLYPLLFMLVLTAALTALDKPSFMAGVLIGAGGYLVLYFSFSLLALLPMVILWAGLEWLRDRQPGSLRRTILFALGIAAGAALLWAALRLGLNYDILTRYTSAFANHRTTWQFDTWQERMLHGLALNDAEFVTWSGFPIILLVVIRFVKAAAAYLRRRAARLDSLALAFLVTYVLLVALGQTNGEVQRLYLFLMPLVALFAAQELKALFKAEKTGFTFVAVLQLITIFLLFQFQDFYG